MKICLTSICSLLFFTRCDCCCRNVAPKSVAAKAQKDNQKVKESLQQAYKQRKRQLEQQLNEVEAKCMAYYGRLSTCLLKQQACMAPKEQVGEERAELSLDEQAQEKQLKELENKEQQLRKQLEDLENRGQRLQQDLQQLHQKFQQDVKLLD